MSWIQTYSGIAFDVAEPTAEMVSIDDIAHALARIGRFNGHCVAFYSVAQHSLLVASLVPDRLKLPALLHDAAEAYIGDIVRPIKRSMHGVGLWEARITAAICERFGIDPSLTVDPLIKHADDVMLATEKRDLMAPPPKPWAPLPEPVKDVVTPIDSDLAEALFRMELDALMGSGSRETGQ